MTLSRSWACLACRRRAIKCSTGIEKHKPWRADDRGVLRGLGGLRALGQVAPDLRAADNDDPEAFALALGQALPRLRKLFVGLDRRSLCRVEINGRWVPEVLDNSEAVPCL